MSQIDWKKVEAEVKHLYTLPLYTIQYTLLSIKVGGFSSRKLQTVNKYNIKIHNQ